jgi:DNA invertase Pin-like site-specific DNA recombinase
MDSKNGTHPIRAALYCRISDDREGEALGVSRQEADCRALAAREGFEVVRVFVENDTGASTRSRKPRPMYVELIEGVRAGRWDVVVAYSSSRLTRRPVENEALIQLHERYGTRFAFVVSGQYDLSTADGRQWARIAASIDAGEAERTAERVARAKAQAAQEGKFRGGGRPYGYEEDGLGVREHEAAVVREASAAVLAGRSVAAVARDLNSRGERTARGKEWNVNRLRDVLARPRNAALVHRGRVGHPDYEEVGPARWPALVDEETWRALHALLTDPSRLTHHGTDSRWLGSGIYTCGKCGASMRVTPFGGTASRPGTPRTHHYRCSESAHLTIKVAETDEHVRAVVADLVRDPLVVAAMHPHEDAARVADRERRSLLTARLAGFEADYAEGMVTGAQLRRASERVRAEVEEIDARLVAMTQRETSLPVLDAADPGAAFLAAPVDVQRAVLRAVLRVEVLGFAGGGRVWSPNRLRLSPVTSPEAA